MSERNLISQEGRSWMENKKCVRVELSLSGKRKEIHISKDVVRLLGVPAFLCLKVNKALDSIAVMPCSGKEYMSFKVPEGILFDKGVSMRMVSQPFVDTIMKVNGLKADCTYQAAGTYYEKNNAVIFHFEDMRLHPDYRVKTDADSVEVPLVTEENVCPCGE